jgi:hypothetical protein
MGKIESLTPAQEAMMPVYVDRFIKYGLSTDTSTPEDFEKCFEAAVALYRSFSEDISDDPDHVPNDIPTHYEVYDSPKAIGVACKNANFTNDSGYGSCEAGWLAHYTYMRDELGIEISENINHFHTIGEHCFWWYVDVNTKKVYFSRKPVEIHMVDGRLHNESGPSVLFKDGFSIYSIDGLRVSEQIVMRPETMTLKQIDDQQNNDIQSIMINRWFYENDDWAKRFEGDPPEQTTGWLRYIDESGATELDSDKNPLTQMLEILYRTKAGNRLIVGCPTARMFSIGMPNDVRTCAAARQWYPPNLGGETNFIGRT